MCSDKHRPAYVTIEDDDKEWRAARPSVTRDIGNPMVSLFSVGSPFKCEMKPENTYNTMGPMLCGMHILQMQHQPYVYFGLSVYTLVRAIDSCFMKAKNMRSCTNTFDRK